MQLVERAGGGPVLLYHHHRRLQTSKTNEALRKAKEPHNFLTLLLTMLRAKLNGPIGSTSLLLIQYINRSILPTRALTNRSSEPLTVVI